jgi:hypothetical protein
MKFGCAWQKPETVVREETEVYSSVFNFKLSYIITKYFPCVGHFVDGTLPAHCLVCGSHKKLLQNK